MGNLNEIQEQTTQSWGDNSFTTSIKVDTVEFDSAVFRGITLEEADDLSLIFKGITFEVADKKLMDILFFGQS